MSTPIGSSPVTPPPGPERVMLGQLGRLSSGVRPLAEGIDKDGSKTLSTQELKTAADIDSNGDVSEAEADRFIDELRTAAQAPSTEDGRPVFPLAGSTDSLSEEALLRVKSAIMEPVAQDLEFHFGRTMNRTRYASVFCTRF